METLTYITQSELDLQNILEIAQEYSYRADLFTEAHEQLSIRFGNDPSEWWAWFNISRDEMLFDEDVEYEIFRELKPKSVFATEYHVNTLPTLVSFLEEILKRYKGWVECRGMNHLYTVENINEIISGCP